MKPLIGIVSKPNIFCDQELFTKQIIYDGVRNAQDLIILFELLKTKEVGVNSIHTMFANKDDIKNLEISAYSEDGYVEAVELKNFV